MPLAARLPQRALVWAGLTLLGAGSARAAPPLRLQQAAGLPFDEQELVEAVALRAAVAPTAPGAVTVAVEPGDAGRVAIGVDGRRIEADVGGRTGPEAARLVALLLVDATRPPLALERAPAPPRASWSLLPAVNLGLSDAGASLEPTAGFGWRLGPRTRLLASLGYARARVIDRAGAGVMTLDTLPVRVGAGAMAGPIELQAGLVGRGYRAAAITAALGVRAGAWVGAAWALPLGGPLRPFLLAALDAHPQRLELRRAGQPLLAAGYFAPWAGVGLAWRGETR
jgi:hypothetical protein